MVGLENCSRDREEQSKDRKRGGMLNSERLGELIRSLPSTARITGFIILPDRSISPSRHIVILQRNIQLAPSVLNLHLKI